MIQAAAEGIVDFTSAALLDRRWWLKLKWLIDHTEEKHVIDVLHLQHAQHTSVLDYNLPKQAFDSHWKDSNEAIKHVHKIYFPWTYKELGVDMKAGDYDEIMATWKKKYGDIKDPAVKAHFDAVAKALHKVNEDRKKKAEEKPQNTTRDKMKKLVANRRKIRKF